MSREESGEDVSEIVRIKANGEKPSLVVCEALRPQMLHWSI